jgi:hypothetical protein
MVANSRIRRKMLKALRARRKKRTGLDIPHGPYEGRGRGAPAWYKNHNIPYPLARQRSRDSRPKTRNSIKRKKAEVQRLEVPCVFRGLLRNKLDVLREMVALLPSVPVSEPDWDKQAGKREIFEYSPENFVNKKELAPLEEIISHLKGFFGCKIFSGLALVVAHPTEPGNDQNYHVDFQAKESLNLLIPLCTVCG